MQEEAKQAAAVAGATDGSLLRPAIALSLQNAATNLVGFCTHQQVDGNVLGCAAGAGGVAAFPVAWIDLPAARCFFDPMGD